MNLSKEMLKRIIKEELEAVLETIDESQSSSQIYSIKTRKEKMADRAAKEKFYGREPEKLSPEDKQSRAKGRTDSQLRTKFTVASNFPGFDMPRLTPEQEALGLAQGLDTEFPELWSKATTALEEATETPKKFSKEWFAAFEKEHSRPATPEEIETKSKEAAEDPNNPWTVDGITKIPADFKTTRRDMRRYKR